MNRGRYAAPRPKGSNWIIILLTLLIVLVGILIFLLLRPDPVEVSTPDGANSVASDNVQKNEDTISIPGYESITLAADQKEQTVGLPNPANNTCYFKIHLILEDGTVLWESDLVKPGQISDPIKLTAPLEAGTYQNAVLKYECFTMDSQMKQLNGASTKFTLIVK